MNFLTLTLSSSYFSGEFRGGSSVLFETKPLPIVKLTDTPPFYHEEEEEDISIKEEEEEESESVSATTTLTRGFVERWGRFERLVEPSFLFFNPFAGECLTAVLSTRIYSLDVLIETKTRTLKNRFRLLCWMVSSFVINENLVRAIVPRMTFDELFEQKGEVAQSVLEELEKACQIPAQEKKCTKTTCLGEVFAHIAFMSNNLNSHMLMVDTVPDSHVRIAMNEINKVGRGVHTCEDGSRYVGEFKWGVKHGLGHYHFRNGDTYAGEYFADKMHGFGVYQFANVHRYEGAWHEGRRKGLGMYTFRNGETQSGHWQNGVLHILSRF
ncbi:hypothetical protein F8388_018862 [Cannabis sativa]|uniref:Uncharacterized protein n=1 Tax=Cannabis sativa TaxID=3483 RepID=A0A7J6FZL6_CANSA|nr:hypothetical protein F8388_018862 [Cannabis sativa]